MFKLTTISKNLVTFIAAASFAVIAVAPAQATQETVAVKVDRAELASDAGTQRVYRTLERKAENLCGANEGFLRLEQRISSKACVSAMMDNFVRQLESGKLAALHQETLKAAG